MTSSVDNERGGLRTHAYLRNAFTRFSTYSRAAVSRLHVVPATGLLFPDCLLSSNRAAVSRLLAVQQQGCCFQTACCPATGLLFPDCMLSLQQGCCFQTACCPATGLLFPDCLLSQQKGCCFQTACYPSNRAAESQNLLHDAIMEEKVCRLARGKS